MKRQTRPILGIIATIAFMLGLIIGPLSSSQVALAVGTPQAPEFVAAIDASSNVSSGTGTGTTFATLTYQKYLYIVRSSAAASSCSTAVNCELQIYDNSNPSNPVYVHGIDISSNLDSGSIASTSFINIKINNGYIYLVGSGNGTDCSGADKTGCEVQIYDVRTTPATPTWVAGIDSGGTINGGTSTDQLYNIIPQGNYLYVVKAASVSDCSSQRVGCEVQIYNVTNPAAPTFTAGIDSNGTINGGTSGITLQSVAVAGNYLYVSNGTGNATDCSTSNDKSGCEIKIFNIASPASPTFTAGIDTNGTINGGTGSVAVPSLTVSNNYLYAGTSGNATDCATVGNKVGCEVQIYNVSDPTAPVWSSGIDISGSINSGTISAGYISGYRSGSYLYLSKSANGTDCATVGNKIGCEVQIYNVSDPTLPVWASGIDASGTINGGVNPALATSVRSSGTKLYVTYSGSTYDCVNTNRSGCETQIYDVNDSLPISIIKPTASSTVSSWQASVDWNGASTCEYSWNNSAWSTVACSQYGSDIPSPTSNGSHTLYVRGTLSSLTGLAQVAFTMTGISVTDLNNDGIADSGQAYVKSLTSSVTGKTVSLELASTCSAQSLTTKSESQLATSDAAYDYANGLVHFTATCSSGSTPVRIFFYGVTSDSVVLRKYKANSQAFFNLTGAYSAALQQTTIGGQTVTIASYTIADGGPLDDDGVVNGAFDDPVGLASQVVGSPNTGIGRI